LFIFPLIVVTLVKFGRRIKQ